MLATDNDAACNEVQYADDVHSTLSNKNENPSSNSTTASSMNPSKSLPLSQYHKSMRNNE
eukprot:CAMPEP_0202505856 /NCGR_PEP_ID=MMETSP1361-20130828/48475_1 /ASSEMBLY_ACC=CAM_ASM_000849 /TAXON_ID=210615 /ORGANISM="Staurosira complex sp., Strain CCMP2646" /LENGTH=59 /DNA_ID=CAMNT_0049139701 /DNA_START=45 /DNA_END=221 /DNA_ORIENTATION=+